METIKLENNQADCIKQQNMITGTNYINICTGTDQFIGYGNGDVLTWLLVPVIYVGIIIGVMKILSN